jgi:hypothetical protein
MIRDPKIDGSLQPRGNGRSRSYACRQRCLYDRSSKDLVVVKLLTSPSLAPQCEYYWCGQSAVCVECEKPSRDDLLATFTEHT